MFHDFRGEFDRRRVILPIVSCGIFVLAGIAPAQQVNSGNEILERMKANDSQFNHVLVDLDYSRYERVRPSENREDPPKLEIDKSIDPATVPSIVELSTLFT